MEKIKILVIDDDPLFLSLTEKILQKIFSSENVRCISHVTEARTYLDSCVLEEGSFPDVIFLDINMPGIGGLDFAELFTRRYADQFPEAKLFILTTSNSRKDKTKAMQIPAVDGFLQKPLTEEILKNLI